MPALPVLREPLRDGVIELRPMAERDIPEILIAHQDDPGMHARLGTERPPSGAELGRMCEEAEVRRLDGAGMALTVLAAAQDTCLGAVLVHSLDWENGRGALGIWLAPGARGRGWAPRALRLACGWLCREAGLARIELHTETDNLAMLGAAAAAGFTREGVLRGYTRERRRRVDNVVLSLLAEEL